jgi:hypothetical protein
VTAEELAEVRALLDQLQAPAQAGEPQHDFQFKLAFARLQSLYAKDSRAAR